MAKTAPKKRKVACKPSGLDEMQTVEPITNAIARKTRIRGRRGSLSMALDLPVDVLLEIFRHLDPVDLLNLSWTDRTLRAYMLQRSVSLQVWKAAFAGVTPQPPECPDDLSLPQYANLLYGDTCFYCQATQRLTRSWCVYVRACRKCLENPQLFVNVGTMAFEHDAHLALSQITPRFSPINRDGVSVYVRAVYETNREELQQLGQREDQTAYRTYYAKKQEEVNGRYERVKADFDSWEAQELVDEAEANTGRRLERKVAILNKLKELGYAKVLKRFQNSEIAKIPGVNSVRPLNDKEWERVKPGILAVLDANQRDVDNSKRNQLISKRTGLLQKLLDYSIAHNRKLNLPQIPPTQLAKLEPFRTVIYDTPAEEEVLEQHLTKFIDAIPNALETWKAETEEFLLNLLPIDNGKAVGTKGKAPALDRRLLSSATTIFYCKRCGPRYPMTYPFALEHRCLFARHSPDQAYNYRPNRNPRKRNEDRRIQYPNEEARGDPNPPWNEGGDQIIFYEDASKYASAIILALGEDPNVVTWEQMDRTNQRVECLYCRIPKSENKRLRRVAMDWRQAVLHQCDSYKHHQKFQMDKRKNGPLTYKNSWKSLDAASLVSAYQAEGVAYNGTPPTPPRCRSTLYCVECAKPVLSEDGTIDCSNVRHSAIWQGNGPCSLGHTLEQGTYVRRHHGLYDISFTSKPHPVKIP